MLSFVLVVLSEGPLIIYDYVCSETAKGIAKVSLDQDIPVMFGLLTTNTLEQALERSGSKVGNKGWEAAAGAIETLRVCEQIQASRL